jgi:hypothetical protein
VLPKTSDEISEIAGIFEKKRRTSDFSQTNGAKADQLVVTSLQNLPSRARRSGTEDDCFGIDSSALPLNEWFLSEIQP